MSLPISGNIGCYHAGCKNPVIGQCQGYPGHCGRFYCTEHSRSEHPKGVLCLECAHRLVQDREEKERKETEERLFQLYLDAAEQVPRTNRVSLFIGVVLFLALTYGCISMFFGTDRYSSDRGSGTFILFLAAMIVGLYEFWINRKAKKQITELSKILPGFDRFYAEWVKHKRAQESRDTLLALFAAGIAVTATAALRERRISEIEEGIKRALK